MSTSSHRVGRRSLLRMTALGGLAGVVASTAACSGDDEDMAAPPTRVTYGDDPSQFAELHLPDGDPRGVVVVIHGGFWRTEFDYTLGTPLAASLAMNGWAAWNLEYRRVGPGSGGGGGAPATFDDVSAGIDRLAQEDLDLSTVVTLGHSAGGHLATWAAGRRGFPRWSDARVPVTHVISQAGVLDLGAAAGERLGSGATEALLGAPFDDEATPYDPIQHVPLEAPVWCVHGEADPIVPISQSEAYVAAATAAGATAVLVPVEGDHFVVIDADSDAWRSQLAILDRIA